MLSISLRANGRRAVIVGGGKVAARKAAAILEAGFAILVVAPEIDERLRTLLDARSCAYARRSYESADVLGSSIVIAATNDVALNERIVADARAVGALACDASRAERGDFTMAATHRVGDLTISVDSGGNAPAFSARVLRDIAEHFDSNYDLALQTVARIRSYVNETFPPSERGAILRSLADRSISELAGAPDKTLVCATRESALAKLQSRSIAALVAQRGVATTMLGITTHGDRDRRQPIDKLGANNVFVKELENALRERRADYAVHSCKDLASELPADMGIAAVALREDARDAFCSERYASFESLPCGAVIGTSSPRRRAQLASLRPDLRYEVLRGNVDTRLRKLRDGEYDAVVVAMAGLLRLGAQARHTVPFSVEQIVPAVGQGALAVEIRAGDERLARLLREAANDSPSELCVECERSALRTLHAGCSAPIGIHATLGKESMVVQGALAADGAVVRHLISRKVATAEEARTLGAAFALQLKARADAESGVRL